MTNENWITLLGILLGGSFLKMGQLWFKERAAKRQGYHSDGIAFRKNLIKRLKDVEKKEEANSQEIIRLTGENATLKGKVDGLESYNKRLVLKLKEYEGERD